MNKKQINKIVNDAFNDETPDFLSNIKAKCQEIDQIEPTVYEVKESNKPKSLNILKYLVYGLITCSLFVLGLFINIEKPVTPPNQKASIYLDVNPSIEIKIDDSNSVIECLAGNEDGNKILENMNLIGIDFNTAIYAIVGSMYTNGYLNTETNSILVSVIDIENNIVLSDISNQIENVFKENPEMNCSIIAQNVEINDELKNKADYYDISVGKMKLIEKIINSCDLYTEENIDKLSQMKIHELDLIYQSLEKENESDDVISGKPSGFIEYEEAINKVLDYLHISEELIKSWEMVPLYLEKKDNKLVYLVTIEFIGINKKVDYVVDCETGEIMLEETLNEWKDKLENRFNNGKDNQKEDNEGENTSKPGNPR